MIIADLIDRASVTESADGVELQRVFSIADLDGDAASRAASVLTLSGLPRIGEPHPTVAGATVTDRAFTYLDADNAEAVITYRTPARGTQAGAVQQANGVAILSVDFSATTFNERTDRDVNGLPMRNVFIAVNAATVEAVEIDAFRPQLIVRIRHTRPALPRDLAKRFIGVTNRDAWGGEGPETWLCTAFTTEREQGQVVCTFEALYKPESWRVPHVMRQNGLPVTTKRIETGPLVRPVEGEGVKMFQIYRAEPFADLGLAW